MFQQNLAVYLSTCCNIPEDLSHISKLFTSSIPNGQQKNPYISYENKLYFKYIRITAVLYIKQYHNVLQRTQQGTIFNINSERQSYINASSSKKSVCHVCSALTMQY